MTVSFFHSEDYRQASFRYRAAIPARALGVPMNDRSADVWIVAKINRTTPALLAEARTLGKKIIVDMCDLHLTRPEYREAVALADAVTAPTAVAAAFIREDLGRDVTVIPDPYELPLRLPHVRGANLFWFGHALNYHSLERWLPVLGERDVRVMSNIDGKIPWSLEALQESLAWADIVLLPETAPYKSANRAVEAIRQGCFVVAEPHPSLEEIPGIWVGNLLKGIQWVEQHHTQANNQLMQSQVFVSEAYSPERVANAWRTVVTACASSWDAGISPGPAGLTSMGSGALAAPMSSAI